MTVTQQARIYSPEERSIDVSQIDPFAIYVLEELAKAGHKAYLVGGSVRDLLIGKAPKDFDVSTSALPEEVKAIFKKNCMLIGRRFRLAHVRNRNNIIEVATFRQGENESSDLIVRDNLYGTEEQDVLRRDFTVNGLFYDWETESIIDYVGGVEDCDKRIIRTIGEAKTRFCQDPVRMLRAIKFKARYDLEFDEDVKAGLAECSQEIVKSAPARLLEELFRMLESGYSQKFFELLIEHNLLQPLLPRLWDNMQGSGRKILMRYLAALDKLVLHNKARGRPLHPTHRPLTFAVLFYPIAAYHLSSVENPTSSQVFEVVDRVILENTQSFMHFPRRTIEALRFVLSLQFRLFPLSKKGHERVMRQMGNSDFPMALQLLRLRSLVDPTLESCYQHWREVRQQYINRN